MRIVEEILSYSEIELDPVVAFRKGRVLDAMLRATLPPPKRGVFRGTFADFAREDEKRMREALNKK